MPELLNNAADDGEGHGSDAKTRKEAQHTGGDTAWSRCYRLTAVCEMLLCVLLLTAITVLWINYHILKTENYQLQTSNNNLTIERDQLQRERAELQRFFKEGWMHFSFSLYNISTEEKNWTESRQDCRERGADLVIITSKEEQEFTNFLLSGRKAWIGLSYRDTENKWKWVDDTPLSTEFWGRGEPDSKAGDEDCVIAGDRSNPVLNWADYTCNDTFMWICEKTIFN